jgi:hypothetical protein
MGLFDSVKKMFSNPPERMAAPEPDDDESVNVEESSDDDDGDVQLDIAGFDPNDEDAFYTACLHMDSDGLQGGTDQSRAELMRKYGIRDRLHWQTVRDSMYHVLAGTYGSIEMVAQRQANWRGGHMHQMIAGNIAAKQASGEMAPVEGISLETWAALNAALSQGANHDDLLKGAGIEPGRWQRARDEWNARMSRDTTFAITTAYGNAFQAASQGKYGHLAREANAARAANMELTSPLPMTVEQYMQVVIDQDYAYAAGKNAVEALKAFGLSIVDYTDLSSFMGYYINRTGILMHKELTEAMKRAELTVQAKYPGVKAAVSFSV